MVTALSVPLGWVGWELDQRRREKVVVAWIEEWAGWSNFILKRATVALLDFSLTVEAGGKKGRIVGLERECRLYRSPIETCVTCQNGRS